VIAPSHERVDGEAHLNEQKSASCFHAGNAPSFAATPTRNGLVPGSGKRTGVASSDEREPDFSSADSGNASSDDHDNAQPEQRKPRIASIPPHIGARFVSVVSGKGTPAADLAITGPTRAVRPNGRQ
jgi:hypothetical protein